MDKLDKMISEALEGEELEILKKIGNEPSFPRRRSVYFKVGSAG